MNRFFFYVILLFSSLFSTAQDVYHKDGVETELDYNYRPVKKQYKLPAGVDLAQYFPECFSILEHCYTTQPISGEFISCAQLRIYCQKDKEDELPSVEANDSSAAPLHGFEHRGGKPDTASISQKRIIDQNEINSSKNAAKRFYTNTQSFQNIGAGVSTVQPSFENSFYQNPALLSLSAGDGEFSVGLWHDFGNSSYDWLYRKDSLWNERYSYSNNHLAFGLFGVFWAGSSSSLGVSGLFRTFFYDNRGLLDSAKASRSIEMAGLSSSLLNISTAYCVNLSQSFSLGLGLRYNLTFYKESISSNSQAYYAEQNKELTSFVGFRFDGIPPLRIGFSVYPFGIVWNKSSSGDSAPATNTVMVAPAFNIGTAIVTVFPFSGGCDISYLSPWENRNPFGISTRRNNASFLVKPYVAVVLNKTICISASIIYWTDEFKETYSNENWRRFETNGYVVNVGFDISLRKKLVASTRGYVYPSYDDRITSSYGSFTRTDPKEYGYVLQCSFTGQKQ